MIYTQCCVALLLYAVGLAAFVALAVVSGGMSWRRFGLCLIWPHLLLGMSDPVKWDS